MKTIEKYSQLFSIWEVRHENGRTGPSSTSPRRMVTQFTTRSLSFISSFQRHYGDQPLPLTNPCVMTFIYRQSIALTSLRETRSFVVANSNMKDFLCNATKDAEISQQVQDAYFVRPSLPVLYSGGPSMSEFLRGQLYQTVQLYFKRRWIGKSCMSIQTS